jgi:hypothetical protein
MNPQITSSTPAFRVPRQAGALYIERIQRRCHRLIDSSIWAGLSRVQFDAWWTNFVSDEQRYFAACILDALIYRSDPQTVALMQQLFQRALPDAFRQRPPVPGVPRDLLAALSGSGNEPPPIRLVPVIRSGDSPTKSSHHIARQYRRKLLIDKQWIIPPEKIAEAREAGATLFIFIDDFLGTGRQFRRFAEQHEIARSLDQAVGVYAPLVAHVRGVRHLARRLPHIPVVAGELLTDSHSLFHERAPWFNDGVNTSVGARSFYFQLLRERGLNPAADFRLGYGRLSLAYCFEHGVPNNCLPILWHATANWRPFLER